MWSQSVVIIAPPAGDAMDLLKTVEDLAVEQTIAQAGVEAFDLAVLPKAAWLDVQGGDAESAQPLPHGVGDNSGPLPDRICWGGPWSMNRSASIFLAPPI